MTRRLATFVLLTGLLCAGVPVAAQSLYVEGQHYTPLDTPQPAQAPEVLEFFSYGCPHCYEFEDSLGPWVEELPEAVTFDRVPAGLGRRFYQLMALMFHVADHMGVLNEMHPVFFEQIHVEKNRQIGSIDVLAALFEEHAGVSREQFELAANAPEVVEAFRRSEAMAPAYGLRGVPMLVVNGRYAISRNQHVTSYPQMLEVAEYLMQLEGAEAPAAP